MKISIAQINSAPDVAHNLDTIVRGIRRAAHDGATLVIFPEGATCSFDGDFAAFARDRAEETHQCIQAAAEEHNIAVICGSFAPHPNDMRVFNILLVFRPGQPVVTYRKIHLFDAFGFKESRRIAAGDQPVTVEIAGVTVGLAICYDLRFPTLFTRLAQGGAQVIVVAASWGDGPGKAAQWDLLTRARAVDSTSYIVASGQAVRDPGREGEPTSPPLGVGHSGVVVPDGRDQLRFGGSQAQCSTVLDLTHVADIRKRIPVLAHQRL
ncbi:MAG: nitrilase-related carbon-nitrogen hydrolase [Kocuria sp.]|nr:nitrilase-related carbon-nitrogen hydrolase [Kocuria sp.]